MNRTLCGLSLPSAAVFIVLLLLTTPASADFMPNVNGSGSDFQSQSKTATATVRFTEASEGTLDVDDRKRARKIKLKKDILVNFDFMLSDDGEWIIGYRKSAFLSSSPKNPTALIFIHGDKILKTYSYADLMKDPDKAWRSVSHIHWLFGEPVVLFDKDTETARNFVLVTRDGHKYYFNFRTGDLLKSGKFDIAAEEKRLQQLQTKQSAQSNNATNFPVWKYTGLKIGKRESAKLHFVKNPQSDVYFLFVQSLNKSSKMDRFVFAAETGEDGKMKAGYVFDSRKGEWSALGTGDKFELKKSEKDLRISAEFKVEDFESYQFPQDVIQLKDNPVSASYKSEPAFLNPVLDTLGIKSNVEFEE